MTGLALTIRDKRHAGAQHPLLSDLALDLRSGEFVALVGPSGAGKTTLLNIVAGLDARYDGRIERDPAARLGIVFQEPRLLPWLSLRDNLRLVCSDEALIDELLAITGLQAHAQQHAAKLSGGMQRRVALARAFAVRPELLLLDEPFVSLDEPVRMQLHLQLLRLWQRERPTVLLVTHDLREAIALADRVLFLSPPPTRLRFDRRVSLARPRALDSGTVELLYRSWLRNCPDLLGAPVPQEAA